MRRSFLVFICISFAVAMTACVDREAELKKSMEETAKILEQQKAAEEAKKKEKPKPQLHSMSI